MAVSKVVLGNETLVDLTSDTVSENTLLEGTTAHGANGEQITGGVVVTPMYTGTKAAIEEAIALEQIPEDAVVNITDDEETSSFQTQINEINSSLEELETKIYTNLKWTLIAEFTKTETVTVEDLSKFNEIMLLNCGIINNKEVIASTIVPIECFKNKSYIIANYNGQFSRNVRIKYVSDTSISCTELLKSEKCEVYCR